VLRIEQMGPTPEGERSPGTTLRVVTYNILAGGGERWSAISEVLATIGADVVAVQEVEDPAPLSAVASELGYQLLFGEAPKFRHQAVLSRLPVLAWQNHQDPAAWPRNSLEVELELPSGAVFPRIRVHTVHLTAAFQRRGRGEPDRLRELVAVRSRADHEPRLPHLVLGDFNSLAPGDGIRATDFLGQLSQWRRSGVLEEVGAIGRVPSGLASMRWWRDPQAEVSEISEVARAGIPRLPWLVHPLIELVPRGETTDAVVGALLPRAAVRSMGDAGYVDCLRRTHPRADSFTCPTYLPAVRIDYVFATPDLAAQLVSCEVAARTGTLGEVARRASDHFPVVADFKLTCKQL